VIAAALGLLLLAAPGAPPPDAQVHAALEQLYGGHTDTAIAGLRELRGRHPSDPLLPYFEALAVEWKLEQRAESTLFDKEVVALAERAQQMAEEALRLDPADQRARFALAAGHAALARLHLFRLHRTDAARASARMREALLAVDPAGPYGEDAQFGLGIYDYYGDVLPKAVKVLRFFMGLPAGDRARGLERIGRAAERSRFHRVEARVQLYEIHAYWEEKHDVALVAARALHQAYPSSPLWGLKLAEHLRARLGQYGEAARVAEAGLAAARRGELNYRSPIATLLLRLALGEALLADGRPTEARQALLPALELPAGADWTARAHLLVGRTQELEGDRTAALAHYQTAARAPDREVRRQADRHVERPMTAVEIRAQHLVWEARRLREAQHEDALARYTEAARLWPDGVEPFLGVTEAGLRLGQAVSDPGRLRAIAGDKAAAPPWARPWARLLLARHHDLSGDRAQARRLYAEVEDAPSGAAWLLAAARDGLARSFTPVARNPAGGASPGPVRRKP
jgi:tetratricopeptide (TPR) repeat protein